MVDIVEQLCIKSYEITAQNGDYFKAEQGRKYTTTVPSDEKETVTVFSKYWVPVPRSEHGRERPLGRNEPLAKRSGDRACRGI